MEVKEEEKRIEKETKRLAKNNGREKIDITVASVAKGSLVIIAILAFCYVLYLIRSTAFLFLVAMFLAAVVDPFADWSEKYKIPRGVSVIFLYILAIAAIGVMLTMFVPIIIDQVSSLVVDLSSFTDRLVRGEMTFPFDKEVRPFLEDFIQTIDLKEYISGALSSLQSVGTSVFQVLVDIFNGIFNFVLALVIAFFFVVDKKGISKFFQSLLPARYEPYFTKRAKLVQYKIGDWVRGQLLLCLAIGILTFIGLAVLGVKYTFTLALLAAFTELIPYVGPVIAAIPALLVALNQHPWLAFWVLILMIIIQQAENNIIVPLVMKRSVGLTPVVTILAMMVGFQFFGIVGMILGIPVATSIGVFVKDYTGKEK